jgi:carboxypeptidase Q
MRIHHFLTIVLLSAFTPRSPSIDWGTVAKIREEGLQHSRVMDFESYMTDVLGARLTNSRDMLRAQDWLRHELDSLGLANVTNSCRCT